MWIFQKSIIYSLALHILVIAVFIIGSIFFVEMPLKQNIVVELVNFVPSASVSSVRQPIDKVDTRAVLKDDSKVTKEESLSPQEINNLLQEKKVLTSTLQKLTQQNNDANEAKNILLNNSISKDSSGVKVNSTNNNSKEISKNAEINKTLQVQGSKKNTENKDIKAIPKIIDDAKAKATEKSKEDNSGVASGSKEYSKANLKEEIKEEVKDSNENNDNKESLLQASSEKEIDRISGIEKNNKEDEIAQEKPTEIIDKKEVKSKEPIILKKDDDFDLLLNNVVNDTKDNNDIVKDINNIADITSNEKKAITNKIAECWANLASIREQDLILDISIIMNQDKLVRDVKIISFTDNASIKISKQEVENIEQQIKIIFSKQQCMILPMPDGKYEIWKTFAIKLNLKGFFQ